jgi:hypothetical protein
MIHLQLANANNCIEDGLVLHDGFETLPKGMAYRFTLALKFMPSQSS